MRRLILTITLPLIVFLFSLTPNAGAQTACEFFGPFLHGVVDTYCCVLDCPCDPDDEDPQCIACDQLGSALANRMDLNCFCENWDCGEGGTN